MEERCVYTVGGIGICCQSAQPTQLGLHSLAVFSSLNTTTHSTTLEQLLPILSLSLSNQSCKWDPLHCSSTLIPYKLHTGTIMISPILPIYLLISSFIICISLKKLIICFEFSNQGWIWNGICSIYQQTHIFSTTQSKRASYAPPQQKADVYFSFTAWKAYI